LQPGLLFCKLSSFLFYISSPTLLNIYLFDYPSSPHISHVPANTWYHYLFSQYPFVLPPFLLDGLLPPHSWQSSFPGLTHIKLVASCSEPSC
jgi:hypothetical protein